MSDVQVGSSTNLLLKQLVEATRALAASGGTFLTVAEANLLYFRLDGGNSALTATSSTVVTVPDAFSLTSLGSIGLTAAAAKPITATFLGATSASAFRVNFNALPTSSLPALSGGNDLRIDGVDNVAARLMMYNYGQNSSIFLLTSRGTAAAKTAVLSGDQLSTIGVSGYDGTNYGTAAEIRFYATQDWTGSAHGARIRLRTVANNTTGTNDSLIIEDYGKLTHQPTTGSSAAWGTTGALISSSSATITDTSSSGTVASAVSRSLAGATFAASNATTFTDAANLYVSGGPSQGTNVTITNSWGLWNVGKTRLDGTILVGASSSSAIPPLFTNSVANFNRVAQVSFFASTPNFYGVRAQGSSGSPTTLASGNTMISVGGVGYDGTAYAAAGSLAIVPMETWSNTAHGTQINFATVIRGTTASQNRWTIGDHGQLVVDFSSGGSQPAWGTTGVLSAWGTGTLTDSSSSGTVATAVSHSYVANVYAASSSTTFTDAANLYIAGGPTQGTNVTITNSWGLWNVGKTRLDSDTLNAGRLTVGTNALSLTTQFRIAGNFSHTYASTVGAATNIGGNVYTDTTSSGTVTDASILSVQSSPLAASSVTTYTDAASVYIIGAPSQGSNVTITNAWGIWNAGKTRFDDNVRISTTKTLAFGATANATIGVSADTTAGILTLTAPSAGSISLTGKTAVTKPFVTTPQALTYASPTSVDVTLASCFTVTTVNGTGSVTFNATAGGTAGQEMTILITNDATSAKTITFGTNFKSTGTLTASAAGRQTTISFKSDGTNWLETGRAVLTS